MQKALLLLCILILTSCAKQESSKLRIGYLLNLTHIVPIHGLATKAFGDIDSHYFFSGGYVLSSLLTKNIDLAYMGPGPYINARAQGADLRILSTVAYGANSLIVDESFIDKYKTPELLKIGVPQWGNTQDLLAKQFVSKYKLAKRIEYIAISPAEMETAFFTKAINAALVSEPWGTLLAEQKNLTNYHKLLNKNRWIGFSYPATYLVVEESVYQAKKDEIDSFLAKQNQILTSLQNSSNKSLYLNSFKNHLKAISNKDLDIHFLEESFKKISFNSTKPNALNHFVQLAKKANYIKGGVKI